MPRKPPWHGHCFYLPAQAFLMMRAVSMQFRVAALYVVAIIFGEPTQLLAHCGGGQYCECSNAAAVERCFRAGPSFVIETANFQVSSDESEVRAKSLARHAEALRRELATKWLGEELVAPWASKCRIVLHSKRASYAAAVGRGGERTVGSSLVQSDRGQVIGRRIDLLGGNENFLTAALPHELTHVVLAERFANQPLPRWADEGIAIFEDSTEKRARHREVVEESWRRGTIPHLSQLMGTDMYPPTDRWGEFYGQSGSLTQFLVEKGSPAALVTFLERAAVIGYDDALRDCYGIDSVAALDAQWRQQLMAVAGRP